MKTFFEKQTVDEILSRIDKLTPESQRVWGSMNVNQMLAHCTVGIKSASGELLVKPRFFISLIGSFLKSLTTNDKPFRKESPTHPSFIIGDTLEFEKEKQILMGLIKKFHDGGEKNTTTNPHAFFGKLTPLQWGSLQYKHLDHHLRQFGV